MLFCDTFEIESGYIHNAGYASSTIKQILKKYHFSKRFIKRVAVASYEAEINIVIHSLGGFVFVIINESNVELLFKDVGPGIPEIDKAMLPGWSTAGEFARLNGFGAGMGLPNMKASADNFIIESNKDGTKIVLNFNVRDDEHDG